MWLQRRSSTGTVRVAQEVVPNLRVPTDYLVYLRGSEAGLLRLGLKEASELQPIEAFISSPVGLRYLNIE